MMRLAQSEAGLPAEHRVRGRARRPRARGRRVLRAARRGAGPDAPARSDLRGHRRGEPAWLRQCVANLVDNAIRYTPDGGTIEVALALEEVAEAGSEDALVRVVDDGIGIEPEERERIFEPYHRVRVGLDAHRARRGHRARARARDRARARRRRHGRERAGPRELLHGAPSARERQLSGRRRMPPPDRSARGRRALRRARALRAGAVVAAHAERAQRGRRGRARRARGRDRGGTARARGRQPPRRPACAPFPLRPPRPALAGARRRRARARARPPGRGSRVRRAARRVGALGARVERGVAAARRPPAAPGRGGGDRRGAPRGRPRGARRRARLAAGRLLRRRGGVRAPRARRCCDGARIAPFTVVFDDHPSLYHWLQAGGHGALRHAASRACAPPRRSRARSPCPSLYLLLRRDLGRAGAGGGRAALRLLAAPRPPDAHRVEQRVGRALHRRRRWPRSTA